MTIIFNGIAYLLLLGSAAAPAQNRAIYDLKCSGTVTSLRLGQTDNKPSNPAPYAMKLHIDLRQKTFCQDMCKVSESIWKVLPANIIFRSVSGPQLERLWVTDDGQFSNTWIENQTSGDDKSQLLMSAQGGCERQEYSQSIDLANSTSKLPAPKAMLSSASVPDSELSVGEISALMDIKNHRPVSAQLHMRLHTLGYAHLKDDLWVLTRKGEKIVSGN
jgi:hypothetical protein